MYSANINSGNRHNTVKSCVCVCVWNELDTIFVFFFFIFFSFAGPFTQLVWSNTKELGIGKACSRSGRMIVVANYYPKGNLNGQYANNVHMNQYFLPVNNKKLEIITRHWEKQTTRVWISNRCAPMVPVLC